MGLCCTSLRRSTKPLIGMIWRASRITGRWTHSTGPRHATSFTTLAGNELAVTVDGDTVSVGGATVTEYDLIADNGVVHVIDMVLTPPAG